MLTAGRVTQPLGVRCWRWEIFFGSSLRPFRALAPRAAMWQQPWSCHCSLQWQEIE